MPSSDYPDAVLRYAQVQGWNANLTELKEGAYIIGGAREHDNNSERMLLMAICEPEKKVKPEHLEYLVNAGKEKNADFIFLTSTADISEKIRKMCGENGIKIISSESVRSQHEENNFGSDPEDISIPGPGSSTRSNSENESNQTNNPDKSSGINQPHTDSNGNIDSNDRNQKTNNPLKINNILLFGLLLPIIYFSLAFIDGFMLGAGVISENTIIRPIANGLNIIGLVGAPLSFHYDKKSIEKESNWSPSGMFYLMFIPILNIILSIYYLKKRRDKIGIKKKDI